MSVIDLGRRGRSALPAPELLHRAAADRSGLLLDLDYADDLTPYLVGHRRLKQIREQPPLLVYADPHHCGADATLSRIRQSLNGYPRLADSPTDAIRLLTRQLSGPGCLRANDGHAESLRIVLFSSADPVDPLGFLVLYREAVLDPARTRLLLSFNVPFIYIMPEHRELGYGTALCVAAGLCCGWEIRHQVERYRPFSITISPALDTGDLSQRHPRLTNAMEARIVAMVERDMDAALSRCNVCLELLHR
jgi:hypothetical protein